MNTTPPYGAHVNTQNVLPSNQVLSTITKITMIKGNFLGAAIVAIIYTVFILLKPNAIPSKTTFIIALIVLNALTIILMSFAFKV